MDGEQMDYKIYKANVDISVRLTLFVKECTTTDALNLAKDKAEEVLINTFSDVLNFKTHHASVEEITIYQ